MIQKATWIIPGILVTLLLGLLWVLPTSAAERGVVEFLDERGGDEISYASPLGDKKAIWIQVTDADENAPKTGLLHNESGGISVIVLPDARRGFIADTNNDGKENGEDFSIHRAATGSTLTEPKAGADVTSLFEVVVGSYTESSGSFMVSTPSAEDANAFVVMYKYTERSDIGGFYMGKLDEDDMRTPKLADHDNDDSTVEVRVYKNEGGVETYAYTGPDLEDIPKAAEQDDTPLYEDDPVYKTVVVKSGAHGAGISLRLHETGTLTGVFGTEIEICDSLDSSCKAVGFDASPPGDEPVANADKDSRTFVLATPVMLPVNASGDTIVLEYRDKSPSGTRRESLSIESSPPAFNGASPASGSSGSDDDPEFSIEVRDAEAGIIDDDDNDASLHFVFTLYDTGGDKEDGPIMVSRSKFGGETSTTNGFSVQATFTNGDDPDELNPANLGDEYEIRWWVVAMDQAGNQGVSDQKAAKNLTGRVEIGDNDPSDDVPDDESTIGNQEYVHGTETKFIEEIKAGDTITVGGETRIVDAAPIITDTKLKVTMPFRNKANNASATTGDCIGSSFDSPANSAITMAGCDAYVYRVDEASPELETAETGTRLDGSDIKTGSDGSRTSIALTFNEDIDCDSVSKEDFEVDDVTPNDASCHVKHKKMVFLDVDELDANAKPKVEVVGSVSDIGGNALTKDDVTAKDGIPAKLTVTVTGTASSRPATKDSITVTISSDEGLGSPPNVMINQVYCANCETYNKDGMYDLENGDKSEGKASATGVANEWSYTASPSKAGLYNVYVTGMGLDGLDATKGLDTMKFDADSLDDDNPIVFEVDTGIPNPEFTPNKDEPTDDPSVFLKVDFEMESKEYGLKGEKDVGEVAGDDTETPHIVAVPAHKKRDNADMPNDINVNFDTHKTVMITMAMLKGPGYDDEDVTAMFSSRDDITYIWRPGNLAEGDYTLTVKAKDEVGNEKTVTSKFKVTPRKPFVLPLQPGNNLVSLPTAPADGSIDTVFGGEAAISLVMTYDNASGLWMAASRGEDGMFVGDLTVIDARHAYWVVADQQVDVNVVLPRSGDINRFPPAIEVYEGWNLVPVASAEDPKAGDTAEADVYFANIDWDIAYGYDSFDGRFTKITENAEDGKTSTTGGVVTTVVNDESDDLKTGSGYWVYANEKGVIIP